MDDKTAPNANAFASTFYFYLRKMQPHEKIKRACKPTHGTVQGFGANLTRQCFDRERSPAGNNQGFVASARRTMKPMLHGTPLSRRRAGDYGD